MKINQHKSEEFEKALKDASADDEAPQPLCRGKYDQFADYDTPPSEAETKQMCAPCPLLAICRQSAIKVQRPSWGIQGGIAWRDGRQYHWLEKLGLLGEN